MKPAKFVLGFLCAAFIMLALVSLVMIIHQAILDTVSNDSTAGLLRRAKFNESVRIGRLHDYAYNYNEELHRGYASVELIARFLGFDEIPVPDRGRERWSNSEFYAELKRVFPQYQISRHSNLRNTELINLIYDSLYKGNPAIVFHAAEMPVSGETGATQSRPEPQTQWEKRYTAVTGMDLRNDRITLNDPHGGVTQVTLADFIRSVRFESYETSFFDILSFALRVYRRNTVYIIERTPPPDIRQAE